jgi:hypothetical protein
MVRHVNQGTQNRCKYDGGMRDRRYNMKGKKVRLGEEGGKVDVQFSFDMIRGCGRQP